MPNILVDTCRMRYAISTRGELYKNTSKNVILWIKDGYSERSCMSIKLLWDSTLIVKEINVANTKNNIGVTNFTDPLNPGSRLFRTRLGCQINLKKVRTYERNRYRASIRVFSITDINSGFWL